jgi:hypothetical protein
MLSPFRRFEPERMRFCSVAYGAMTLRARLRMR